MAIIDNLLHYYKFDGDVLDAHGSNDGTNSGTSSGAGIINNGRDFTPTDEIFITDVTLTGDFTWQSWVNIDNNNNHLFSDTGETSGNEGRTRFDGTGILMGTQSEANVIINDGTTLSTGAGYQHLVIIRDSGTMRVYIDNIDTSDSVGRSGILVIDTIGGKPGAATGISEFEGQMDEVAIWDRALSAAEVSELYNSGSGLAYPFITDVTISPSAFSLSTSEQAPSLFIDISQSSVFGLTAGLPVPNMDAPIKRNRGTVGTQDIATRFPLVEGLIAGTTKQTVNPNLVAREKGSF